MGSILADHLSRSVEDAMEMEKGGVREGSLSSSPFWVKLGCFLPIQGASLVAPMAKNLPAMQETWILSLCWEDFLEKGMATHSTFLAWRILWTDEPGGLPSMGSDMTEHASNQRMGQGGCFQLTGQLWVRCPNDSVICSVLCISLLPCGI